MISIDRYLESCVIEDIDNMSDYDKANFENRKSFLMNEGMNDILSVVLGRNSDFYTDIIDRTLESFKDMAVSSAELSQFFENISPSPMIDDMPLATKVYDISVIDKIRPQYLSQVTNDMMNNISNIINGRVSTRSVEDNYLSDSYVINCKKRMVRTTIPYNIKNQDIVKSDGGMIVKIDGEFLSSNLLPFLRNIPQSIKEMATLSSIATSTISKCYEDISVYVSTIDKLKNEGKVSMKVFRDLNEYMYKAARIFMQLSSYLTFIILKKINLYMSNIRSYNDLKIKILEFYPEGENIIHESVIDGNLDDIDMHDLVHDVLMNNNSTFRLFIDNIINRELSDASYAIGPVNGDLDHSILDQELSKYDYKSNVCAKIVTTFKELKDCFITILANAKDGMIPFDDIVEKSGLNQDLNVRFTSLISDIKNVNYYESIMNTNNLSIDDKKDVYFMILNELKDLRSNADNAVESIHLAYKEYCDTIDLLKQSDPLVYPNGETNNELVEFLDEFDSNLRHFILNVMVSLIDRVKSLIEIVKELKNEVVINTDVDPALSLEDTFDDLFESITESYQDISDIVDGIYFESAILEYKKAMYHHLTGGNLIYEADGDNGPATSPNAENNANNQNQNNQNQNNSDLESRRASLKNSIQKLMDMIKGFFTKSINQLNDIMEKQSGNLTWLQNNKEALENRNFNGIVINVLPYEQYWTTDAIINDINALRDKINNLNAGNIKQYNTKQKLNNYLFSFMENGVGNRENINDIAKNYYKVKNAKLEVMPYRNAQAKNLTPTMVDYCIGFYSGFGDNLKKSLDDLQKSCNDKLQSFENINESVLYEADGNDQNQNNQNNQNQNNTKATVRIKNDNTDSKVSGGNVNKSDNTYNILKWLSMSVQYFSAAVLTGTRDRNYDYLKILKAILPKNANQNNQNQNNAEKQNTENQNEGNAENQENNQQ